MDNIRLGRLGEDLASRYLEKNNYTIVKRNYRTDYGEIDIIAKNRDFLVFIEVKTRRNKTYGEAAEAVNFKKQNKILNTSLIYLSETSEELQVRYDVIEVYIIGKKPIINHFENAFNYG